MQSLSPLIVLLFSLTACFDQAGFTGSSKSKVEPKQSKPSEASYDDGAEAPKRKNSKLNTEDLNCKLSLDKLFYRKGEAIQLSILATGAATGYSFAGDDGKLRNNKAKLNLTAVNDGQVLSAEVFGDGEKGVCQATVAVVDDNTVIRDDLALCAKKEGAGREILVLNSFTHPLGIPETFNFSLDKNLPVLESKTGLKFTRIDEVWTKHDEFDSEVKATLKAKSFDAIWIVSNYHINGGYQRVYSAQILDLIKAEVEKGVGLAIFSDMDAIQVANQVLSHLFPTWNTRFVNSTNYLGPVISKDGFGNGSGIGLLYEHDVTAGLFQNVAEGHSISALFPKAAGDSIIDSEYYSQVLKNSAGHISVAAVERPLPKSSEVATNVAKDKEGNALRRVILHGGLTSLWYSSDTNNTYTFNSTMASGMPQFISNIACWTSGVQR